MPWTGALQPGGRAEAAGREAAVAKAGEGRVRPLVGA